MRRTVIQYLDDILESIGNIEEDTTGISFEEFSRTACAGMQLSGIFR